MEGGAWWATVHGITKSQTRLSHFTSLQCIGFHVTLSICPILSFSHCVQSVLYVCVSILALQMGLLIPFFF